MRCMDWLPYENVLLFIFVLFWFDFIGFDFEQPQQQLVTVV